MSDVQSLEEQYILNKLRRRETNVSSVLIVDVNEGLQPCITFYLSHLLILYHNTLFFFSFLFSVMVS